MKKISAVLLGTGNVATFLVHNLHKNGIRIERIIARNAEKACELASFCGAEWSCDFSNTGSTETIIVSAIKDSAAQEVWEQCSFGNRLVLHTAGALPLDALAPFANSYGVLYPLQSISAGRIIDSRNVPFFIEANNGKNLLMVKKFAEAISDNVTILDSEKRKKLHLAAVFANNFSNLMFHAAWKLLEQDSIDPELLLPIIDETCAKLHSIPPSQAQTGPAIRWDENVMDTHLDMLAGDKELAELYRIASTAIHNASKK